MPENAGNPLSFFQELKRRKVVRVIIVYAAASFVILELASIIQEPFGLPDWTIRLVFVILLIGLIIAIILSWIYDITPEGIEKTKPIHQIKEKTSEKPSGLNAWKIATYTSVAIIAGLIIFHTVKGRKQTVDLKKIEKSIAVLPFDNMSTDKEFSHLGDAITDEIILELQKIREFDRILSRSSTMQFRDNRPTVPEMAEKLGVNFIIEGSVQRHKDDVSIRVQVIRAKHEDHIWGDEYDGKWEDVFTIQDQIAIKVAHELKMVLSPKEIKQIDKQPTDNLDAYNLYLKGRFFWQRRTEKDLKRSIIYFNQAIKIDSNYALAYSGLADAYHIMAWWGWYPRKDGYEKGKEYALKALSIDYDIAEAHATLGTIACWYDWDWNIAEKELTQAITLNNNYATAHQWYAGLLHILGRNKEAREQINQSLKLNPQAFAMYWLSSVCYYHNTEYEMAIEESKKALELENENGTRLRIIKSYIKLGEDEKAYEHIKNIITIDDSTNLQKVLDKIYQKSEIKGIIYWFIDWIVVNEPDGGFHLSSPNYIIAALYSIIGDTQQALKLLENGFDNNEASIPQINSNPDFEILRDNPKFIVLLKEMRLI
jgi:TolB-like protein